MNIGVNHYKQELSFKFIKKDVESEIIFCFFENIIYLLISFIFLFLFSIIPNFSNETTIVQIIFFVFGLLICLISILAFSLFIFRMIISFKTMINLKKGKFVIETDRLVERKELKYIGTSGVLSKLYCLQFEKFSPFEIGRKKYYKWSKMFNMNAQSLYNSSLPDDEFYLIIFSNKVPTVIYNKKYFCFGCEKTGDEDF